MQLVQVVVSANNGSNCFLFLFFSPNWDKIRTLEKGEERSSNMMSICLNSLHFLKRHSLAYTKKRDMSSSLSEVSEWIPER